MNKKNKKNTENLDVIDLELSKSINEQLENNNIQKNDIDEIDPDELIKTAPLISMAESLYHIERSLKGMLYIMNVGTDSGLSYSRDHFMSIFGGEDPEILQEKEIERLRELDEKFKK